MKLIYLQKNCIKVAMRKRDSNIFIFFNWICIRIDRKFLILYTFLNSSWYRTKNLYNWWSRYYNYRKIYKFLRFQIFSFFSFNNFVMHIKFLRWTLIVFSNYFVCLFCLLNFLQNQKKILETDFLKRINLNFF